MQGSNVVEGFGLAGQAERLLALPGPFHVEIVMLVDAVISLPHK